MKKLEKTRKVDEFFGSCQLKHSNLSDIMLITNQLQESIQIRGKIDRLKKIFLGVTQKL